MTFPATKAEYLMSAQAAVMLSLIGWYNYKQWRLEADIKGRYTLISTENKAESKNTSSIFYRRS